MSFQHILLFLRSFVKGIQYWYNKLFTHEKTEVDNENLPGVVVIGIFMTPLLLVKLIKWFIKVIKSLIKNYQSKRNTINASNNEITNPAKKKTLLDIIIEHFKSNKPKQTEVPASVQILHDNGANTTNTSNVWLSIAIKSMFGLGIAAGIALIIYFAFFDKPYNPLSQFKPYNFKYILPEGYEYDDNNYNNNSSSNSNNSLIYTPDFQYYTPPVNYNTVSEETNSYEDNSRWENYYRENYERMANLAESEFNTIMTITSGVNVNDDYHAISTDNDIPYYANSQTRFMLKQTQKEMRSLRNEARSKYGIIIEQSEWETAVIN